MFVHAPGHLCTVSTPTIVASSNSDVCRVVSQRSLSYTCTNNGLALTWTSSVWSGSFSVFVLDKESVPVLNVTGVTLMENTNNNIILTCLSSTLTFTGNLSALTQLNGAMLNCREKADQDSIVIIVPSKNCIKISAIMLWSILMFRDQFFSIALPGPPTLMNITSSLACDLSDSSNQATLQWTPPTNTGGLDVVITHYVVSVTGPTAAGYTCPPDQCNVTTTNTTLTGLQCNISYMVSVRAINCRGEGNYSDSVEVFFHPTTSVSCSIGALKYFNLIRTYYINLIIDIQSSSTSPHLIKTVTYTQCTFVPVDTGNV